MASLNNDEKFHKIRYALEHDNAFVKEMGITLLSLGEDSAETEMVISPQFLNFHQTVHGGALYTLADTTAGIAAISATGCACVTLNSSISFLSPAGGVGAKLIARAKALRWGRRTAVCEVYIYDQDEALCVRGTFTFCPAWKFIEDDTRAACEPAREPLTQE